MISSEKNHSANARVLALDYGRAHTGAAVADPTGTIVRPLEDIDKAGTPDGLKKIKALIAREQVGLVVVGMPLSLQGVIGGQAHETGEFVKLLEASIPVPVATWDERFTSKIAQARGRMSGASQHSLAACVLLEDYLSSQKYLGQG